MCCTPSQQRFAALEQAAAALGRAPADTPQLLLSSPRRRPRRNAAADAAPGRPSAFAAEAAAIARRSVHYEVADPRCQPTLHAGFSGGTLNWGMSFKVHTAQQSVQLSPCIPHCLRRLPFTH